MRVWFWNFRFKLGWRILPGQHKHVLTLVEGEECDRCQKESRYECSYCHQYDGEHDINCPPAYAAI